MDWPFIGLAFAKHVRAKPDTLQSLLMKMRDEVKYLSIGKLEPPEVICHRTVHMFDRRTETTTLDLQPIMTPALCGFLASATLLQQHLIDMVHDAMSNYDLARHRLQQLTNIDASQDSAGSLQSTLAMFSSVLLDFNIHPRKMSAPCWMTTPLLGDVGLIERDSPTFS